MAIENLDELRENLKKYQYSRSTIKASQANKTYERNSDYILSNVILTEWQIKRAKCSGLR